MGGGGLGGARGGGADGDGCWHVYSGASEHCRTKPSSDLDVMGQFAGSVQVQAFVCSDTAHTCPSQHSSGFEN